MPFAKTHGDALGVYRVLTPDHPMIVYDLGGMRSHFEISPTFVVNYPIPALIIQAMSGYSGVGTHILSGVNNTLKFTAIDGTQGAATSILANDTVLVEDTNTSKWVRVYRDYDYSTADIGGLMELSINQTVKNIIGVADVTSSASVQSNYAAIMLHNHEAFGLPITSVTAWVGTLGTQQTSDGGQLGGAGAGTITTTGTFVTWPESGWVHIKNAGATREIAYYSSRTDTVLTIPTDGRGRLGTSAAAGAGTDTIDAVPGIRIASEAADADGLIQEIASITTAPTAVTFDSGCTSATGVSIGTLTSMQNAGLWIHREIPANVDASIYMQNKIELSYVVDGVTYYNTLRGHYSIADTSLEQYELYVGEDAAPDLTAAPEDTGATASFTYAVTPPGAGTKAVNVLVRKRNKYNLTSKNTYYLTKNVDSLGADADTVLTNPSSVTLTDTTWAGYRLNAVYNAANDATPATHFRLYFKNDGTDPDPAIDTPADLALTDTTYVNFNMMTHTYYLTADGTSTFGTDIRYIVRTYNSDLAVESDSDTVYQLTIGTDSMTGAAKQNIGLASGVMSERVVDAHLVSTEYGSGASKIFGRNYEGFASLFSLTKHFCTASMEDVNNAEIRIDVDLTLDDVAHSTAAPGEDIIEYVSGDKFYLIVNETRRAMFDFGTGKIEAASFEYGADLSGIPVNNVNYQTDTELYFLILDPTNNIYTPWMCITSAGALKFAFDIKQVRS